VQWADIAERGHGGDLLMSFDLSTLSEQSVHDVVVIGGGIAGWTAARRSQGLGARVALLERGVTGPGWSNSRLSGGRIHASYLNPRTRTPDDLYTQLMKKTDGHARPDVARAWAENTGRAVDFLVSEGANIEAVGGPQYMQTSLQGEPGRTPDLYATWRDGGPDRTLNMLWRSFMRDGGMFYPGVRARELETQDGAVVGVRVEHPDGSRELIRGRTVVMADGGFQANRELMQKYGVIKHSYRLLGSEYDTGDCLLMALRLGVSVVEMAAFYGNVSLRDQISNERLRAAPTPAQLVDATMVVNGSGERVGDEATGSDEWSIIEFRLANAIAKTDAPGDSWIVFDDDVWETVGRDDEFVRRNGHTPEWTLNPGYVEAGGTFLSAGSIAELARQAGIPPERLELTVAAFNRFCLDGTPLVPVRTEQPRPILTPPFHAIPLCNGIYFTMGGVLVNAQAQVLDEKEQPIAGLYAAGGTMGGLQGGPRNGYAGGWSEAITFGLLAAEHAVSTLRAPAAAGAR
jgi:fumarate reductase flavoprotein subunit